jgi:hypothetical protein
MLNRFMHPSNSSFVVRVMWFIGTVSPEKYDFDGVRKGSLAARGQTHTEVISDSQ